MDALKIGVEEGQSLGAGVRTVVGSITLRELDGRYAVDTRDFHSQSGYQRPLSTTRVNKLARDLDQGIVDIPTAILLNLREFTESWLGTDGNGGRVLTIPEGVLLWGVDGQHRVGATEKLYRASPDRWSSFRLQFVMMLGATPKQEMRQFYVVNSNAKSVRTDLAYDLLKQQAHDDPQVMRSLIDQDEKWKVDAQALVEKLGLETAIWKGLVRFPGEPATGTTITSSSMVSSVKKLLKDPFFGQLPTDSQAQVLNAYWAGIAQVLSDAFAEPSEFAIQKGLGAIVLNGVFLQALAVVQSHHDSPLDPQAYADVMREALETLEGETADGDIVAGSHFWRSGATGAAGSFSSSAGRRVLMSRILHALPAPEVMTL
jgi:DGQHR domain-containing protein